MYALLRESPRAVALGHGVAAEPLRAVPCGDLTAVVGEVAASPEVDAQALRGHDAVIRRLHGAVDALLPVRFGAAVADEQALAEAIDPRADDLRAALELVAGCYQVTLRVFGEATVETEAAEEVGEGPGAGTRYLTQRLRAETRARSAPEIEPLREALGGLVRAERVERHDAPPLVASVYHLVRAVDAGAYDAAFAAAVPRLSGIRIRRSGPWDALRRELEQRASAIGVPRWNADPDDVRRSVAHLVLSLVEFIRKLLERQAIRRMEMGTLTADETEAVGLALMRLEETVRELAERFGIPPEDLNLDLGPLGRLS